GNARRRRFGKKRGEASTSRGLLKATFLAGAIAWRRILTNRFSGQLGWFLRNSGSWGVPGRFIFGSGRKRSSCQSAPARGRSSLSRQRLGGHPHVEGPNLRRCLHLWPDLSAGGTRQRPQTRDETAICPSGGMGCSASGAS